MNTELLRGRRVCLSAIHSEEMSDAFSRWGKDTEYLRLLDSDPPRLWSKVKFKEWLDKDLEKNGFQREGIIRQAMRRDGQRWDVYLMGVFRSDWKEAVQ